MEERANSKESSFDRVRTEFENDRNILQKKIDEMKEKNNGIHDDYLNRKILLEKNLALS